MFFREAQLKFPAVSWTAAVLAASCILQVLAQALVIALKLHEQFSISPYRQGTVEQLIPSGSIAGHISPERSTREIPNGKKSSSCLNKEG